MAKMKRTPSEQLLHYLTVEVNRRQKQYNKIPNSKKARGYRHDKRGMLVKWMNWRNALAKLIEKAEPKQEK